jgi:hypothetical protein
MDANDKAEPEPKVEVKEVKTAKLMPFERVQSEESEEGDDCFHLIL